MEGAGKVHSPWYKFLSLPSLPLPFLSKMAAIIFAKKILSTHSPKLRMLFRLTFPCYRELTLAFLFSF